jgi:hypothetical protein
MMGLEGVSCAVGGICCGCSEERDGTTRARFVPRDAGMRKVEVREGMCGEKE